MELLKAPVFNSALCLSYSKKAVTDTNKLKFMVKANRDRKTILQLKAELDKVNFKYNAVLNSSYTYYIILNKQLKIIDYNVAYVNLMNNISSKKLEPGLFITDYFNGTFLTEVLNSCKRALAGETFVFERKTEYSDEVATWWLIEYSPAYDGNKKIAGLVVNIIDITSRKKHELQIEMQYRQLRAISLMQSHEIRGPLCTLMGLMSVLKTEGPGGYATYLPLMDVTINLLDIRIRNIVECANE